MTTIKTSLSIPATASDTDVRDLFAPDTEASAHTWFKAIRCLVSTVTKLDSESKKLGLDPETDNVLVYKKAVAVNGKNRTEWGFDIGPFYVTYKSALSGQSRIMKGDEITFEGAWPELKGFLRAEKAAKAATKAVAPVDPAPEAPAEEPTEAPAAPAEKKTVKKASKTDLKKVAAPVVETEKKLTDDKIADIIDDLVENDEDEQEPSRGFWVRDHRDQYWDADEADRCGAEAFDCVSPEY